MNRGSVYWTKTGSWNYFEIERIYYDLLGQPYNECFTDVYTEAYNSFNRTIIDYLQSTKRIYTQQDCNLICSYLFALQESNCNCNSSLDKFSRNCIRQFYEISSQNDTKYCIANYLENFRKNSINDNKCELYCPVECDSFNFQVNNYLENLPAIGNISKKQDKRYGLDKFNTYEEANKHFVSINIYLKDLKYTLVSQDPKAQIFDLISSIGGILGLFAGISFVSILEPFDILFEIQDFYKRNA